MDLDREGLRSAASVGLETALAIKSAVQVRLRRTRDLVWSGRPSYDQIEALVQLACAVKSPREFGAFSDKQLTYLVSALRGSGSVRQFLNQYDASFRGDAAQYDNIFKFLRSCEYGLPQIFSVVQSFVSQQFDGVDYGYFLRELARWFRPEVLHELDEEGIPIQISERFYRNGDDRAKLLDRLFEAVRSPGEHMSEFERSWLKSALDF